MGRCWQYEDWGGFCSNRSKTSKVNISNGIPKNRNIHSRNSINSICIAQRYSVGTAASTSMKNLTLEQNHSLSFRPKNTPILNSCSMSSEQNLEGWIFPWKRGRLFSVVLIWLQYSMSLACRARNSSRSLPQFISVGLFLIVVPVYSPKSQMAPIWYSDFTIFYHALRDSSKDKYSK